MKAKLYFILLKYQSRLSVNIADDTNSANETSDTTLFTGSGDHGTFDHSESPCPKDSYVKKRQVFFHPEFIITTENSHCVSSCVNNLAITSLIALRVYFATI